MKTFAVKRIHFQRFTPCSERLKSPQCLRKLTQITVLVGETSRKLSTPQDVSDSLWQILFLATPLWFKISTRKIPKEKAKRAGRFVRGNMHHGWYPGTWKDEKRSRWTPWSCFNKINQSKNYFEPRQVQIFEENNLSALATVSALKE